jgi:hypothetical protein
LNRFFRRNSLSVASLVVAATSLFVAVLSLRYSVDAQKADAFYKELSIKPTLQLAATSLYQIKFDNVGLGPAEIRRVVFSDGTHCLDTDSVRDWTAAHAFFDEFTNAIQNYIVVSRPILDKRSARVPVPSVSVPSPGVTIKASDTLSVLSFNPNEMDAYIAYLVKIKSDARTIIEHYMMHRGLTIPLYIYYCSLSGRYCRQTHHDELLNCTRKNSTASDSSPGQESPGAA